MQTSTARRWTPSQIRKALPFPKPQGARGKVLAYESGALGRPGLAAYEQRLLCHIAEHSDLLTVENQQWMLIPLPRWAMEAIAVLGEELADLEPDEGREEGGDDEPEGDEHDGDEQEPGHVRPDTVSRAGLTDDAPSMATPAQRERYRRGDGWGELARTRQHLRAAYRGI